MVTLLADRRLIYTTPGALLSGYCGAQVSKSYAYVAAKLTNLLGTIRHDMGLQTLVLR